jgi:hypothetical protein
MHLGAYLSASKEQAKCNYIAISKENPHFFCCLRAKSRLATGSIDEHDEQCYFSYLQSDKCVCPALGEACMRFSWCGNHSNTRREAHFVSQPFFILCCGRGALEWSSQGATQTLHYNFYSPFKNKPEHLILLQLEILALLLIQHKAQDDTLLPRRANAAIYN